MEQEYSSQINSALDEIREIVSPEWLKVEGIEADELRQSTLPGNSKALGFVYPGSIEEIKAIISVANLHKIAIWPVSKGNNWGFGSFTAANENNLIMVLERLNRIIEVNEKLAYAVVEPGVTYADLYNYLEEKKINLMCDPVEGPLGCSILGNALERGRGKTNYGDHYEHLCGIEVVLPNGKIVRSGGGPDNSKSWNTFKYGVGPSIDGLFSQGNFGVVTKGGVHLMPKHKCVESVLLEVDTSESFSQALDRIRQLQLEGVIESKMAFGNDCFILSSMTECPELFNEGNYLSDEHLTQLRKEYGIGRWSCSGALYGTKELVSLKKRRIKKELSAFGRIRFVNDKKVKLLSSLIEKSKNKASASLKDQILIRLLEKVTGKKIKMFSPLTHMHSIHSGIPSDAIIKTVNYGEPTMRDSRNLYNMNLNKTGMFWCVPVVPLDGEMLIQVNEHCKKICHQAGFDYAAGIVLLNPRSTIVLIKIAFNKDNTDHCQKALSLYDDLYTWCIDNGYQVYRTHTSHMETVINCAPIYKEFVNQIKTSLDPNNIIAPGKYGIG